MILQLLVIELEVRTMRRFNLGYSFKQAFNGIFKNGIMTSASILILVLSMLIIGSFWTITENINFNLSSIDDLNVIVVFLEDDANIEEVKSKLENIPGNPKINFVSKEEALKKEKDRYEIDGKGHLLEIFNDENNPLPDTFEITFENIDKTSTITYHLNKIDGISKIRDMLDVSEKVSDLKQGVTVICSWLLIILVLISFIIIIITIRLAVYSRSKEIMLMKYIGATNFFITFPFIIQGTIIGIVSAGIGVALQYFLYNFVMIDLLGDYEIITLLPFSEFLPSLSIAFLVVGLFAGVVASAISVRRYLNT